MINGYHLITMTVKLQHIMGDPHISPWQHNHSTDTNGWHRQIQWFRVICPIGLRMDEPLGKYMTCKLRRCHYGSEEATGTCSACYSSNAILLCRTLKLVHSIISWVQLLSGTEAGLIGIKWRIDVSVENNYSNHNNLFFSVREFFL